MTKRRSRLGRVVLLSIATLVVPLVLAAPASAHSELQRSEPPDGGLISEGRTSLSLWFSEPIRLEASTFVLYSLGDQAVLTGLPALAQRTNVAAAGVPIPITVSGADAEGPAFVEIVTEPLAKAIYRLDYTVFSADDGHPSRGSLVFGAGIRPEIRTAGGAGLPQGSSLFLRWLELSAIMLAIGAMAVSGKVLGTMGPAGETARRHALVIGAVAAIIGVVVGAMVPFLREPHAGSSVAAWAGATRDTLIATSWGRRWLGREVALIVAATALSWRAVHSDRSGRRWFSIAIVAMAAALLLGASAGHAAGLSRLPWPAALASALHLASAGVWAGGLVILAVCLLPIMRREPDARGPIIASAWRAFSPVAAVSTVVLMASGFYQMGRFLPDLGSLARSVYGGVIAGKLVVIAVALVIAGFNTLLVNPRLAAPVGRLLDRPIGWSPVSLRRFSSLVVAEIVILAVAGVGGAVLTSVSTGRQIELASSTTAARSGTTGGVFVTFEAVPIGDTRSRLIVQARSVVKPEPGPIAGVVVNLVGPSGLTRSVPLGAVEPGRYEAATDQLPLGTWTADVIVARTGLPDIVAPFDRSVVSEVASGMQPFELATAAVSVFLLVGLAVVVIAVRRNQRSDADPFLLRGEKMGSRR